MRLSPVNLKYGHAIPSDFMSDRLDQRNEELPAGIHECSRNQRTGAAPLRKIPDNYEKIVIAMECDLPQNQDGIKIVGAVDFLLEQ